MGATALAQRQARTAPTPAPTRSRRRAHPAPARPAPRRRPLRVVRTAAAIGDAADSRLIVRLTRSQAWIAIIGALLIGIVGLNVYSLAMGSAVSSTAERADDLERQNSLLREQIGRLKRNGEIERFAAKLGLGVPLSEQVTRIAAGNDDAAQAAERLKQLASTTPVAAEPIVEATPTEATPAVDSTADPTAAGATDPTVSATPETTDPAATDAVTTTTDPTVADPATDPTAAAAGGVSP